MSDRGGPAAVDTGAVDDSDQDLGEDETSSAENSNTSKAVNSDAVSSQGQPQYENEDLRLLTEKGVCSPLARTSKAAQLGGPEEQVHTLQTNWCRYNGQAIAVRSSTWQSNQSQGHSPGPVQQGGPSVDEGPGTAGLPGSLLSGSALAHYSSTTSNEAAQAVHAARAASLPPVHSMPDASFARAGAAGWEGMDSLGDLPFKLNDAKWAAQTQVAGSPKAHALLGQGQFAQRAGSTGLLGGAQDQQQLSSQLGSAETSEAQLAHLAMQQESLRHGEALQRFLDQGLASSTSSTTTGLGGWGNSSAAATAAPSSSMPVIGVLSLTQGLGMANSQGLGMSLPGSSGLQSAFALSRALSSNGQLSMPMDPAPMPLLPQAQLVGSAAQQAAQQQQQQRQQHLAFMQRHSGSYDALLRPGMSQPNPLDSPMSATSPVFASSNGAGPGSAVPGPKQDADSPAAPLQQQRAPGHLPARVMMSVTQAPAMFAVPVSIKKQFAPPFVVRVGVISNLPTQIKATVAAYVLNQEQVAKLETWHPAYHAVTEPLAGAVVTQAIVCHNAVYRMPPLDGVQAPAPESHSGFADFTFSELKFMSSSRMKPRWLVFALTLPTDDVMFVQYTVPTIVMSRQCDQQGKALSLLRGQLPWRKRARAPDKPDRAASLPLSRPSASDSQSAQQAQQARSARQQVQQAQQGQYGAHAPVQRSTSEPGTLPGNQAQGQNQEPRQQAQHVQQAKHEQQQRVGPLEDDILDGEWPVNGPYTFERWRDTIERTCKYHHLIRSFDMEDMKMLAQVAGFFAPGTVGRAALETTPGAWQNFGNWFLSYLRLFRCHQQLWCMRNPTAICSFSVDRRKAEQLLFNQPVGTFILRPSLSLCGTMVISCVADGRIKHMALDANQLDSRSLEVWVRDVIEAQQLLDVGSGQRYAKCQVFLLHYRRFGVVMDLTKDALSQMFSAHLPADMLGPGC